MTTTEAFLHALTLEKVKHKYAASSIRTWRSRALRNKLSLDFMVDFLGENGYKMKQSMLWLVVDGGKSKKANAELSEYAVHEKDVKNQLNKKLYAVRKQLNAELYGKWYEWSMDEYAKDYAHKNSPLTPVVFSQMTYGRYISKENMPFALKILKEGKKILHEYHQYIKLEVESL